MTITSRALVAMAGAAALLACKREERRFNDTPPSAPALAVASTAIGNAWDVSEGKRLFEQWNCSGCHSHGGGGMGPPLMDNAWLYGSSADSIVSTIVKGRPNGMPSFRNRITNNQLAQLAAYVRAMAGLESKAASPGRDDDMQYKVDEQRTPKRTPRPAATSTNPSPGSGPP